MKDFLTVLWKEWREILYQGGSLPRSLLQMGLVVGVFGIFLPLQMGRAWVEQPGLLLMWAWVPVLFVINAATDAFAGERERHTLETLLASRLPDWAILLGKVTAAVSYGWGMMMASLVLGLASLNLAYSPIFYSPQVTLGAPVLGLLLSGLAAGAGVLVSLQASTVRQAQLTLGIATAILLFSPQLLSRMLPTDWQQQLARSAAALSPTWAMVAAVAVLVLMNGVLLVTTLTRFRRTRLSLD